MKSAVLLPLEEAVDLVVFEVNEFLLNADNEDDEDGFVNAETDPVLANNMANAMDRVEGMVDAYFRVSVVVDWQERKDEGGRPCFVSICRLMDSSDCVRFLDRST
jgi:hypothetical protein